MFFLGVGVLIVVVLGHQEQLSAEPCWRGPNPGTSGAGGKESPHVHPVPQQLITKMLPDSPITVA